jgi:hypothetical protein
MYEEVTQVIERYYNKPDVDYALLLNGRWGCGKTYYVEHDLKKCIEANGGMFLYASVHGVRDYEEIETHLMFARIANAAKVDVRDVKDAYLASKILNGVKKSGSVVGNIIHQILLHFQLKSIKNTNALDKSKVFIVIDDLERSISPEILKNVIGSIYEEYIHNGFHVLFVCDESRIHGDAGFRECKEKYIRQTIDITRHQEGLCISYAKSKFSRIPWLFESVKEYLSKFILVKHVVNLRVVSMICDGIIDVCAGLDIDFAKKYASFMFSSLTPLLHAVSEGIITTKNIDDYAGLNDLLTVRMFYSSKDKRENISDTEQIACTFFDEYCSEHDYNYVFVKSLFDFAVSGKLRHDLIERDIRKIFERASTPEGLAFDRLRDFWNVEEGDIINALTEVVGFLGAGKYTFEEIVDIYSYFWTIKQDTYVSDWPYSDNLIDMFQGYIDTRAASNPEVVTTESYKSFDSRFVHYNDSRANTKPLLDRIKTIYGTQVQKANAKRVDMLIEALFNNDHTEATRLVLPIEKKWDFFNDLQRFGKIDEIANLPVSGLKFVEYQARDNIIRISNSADFEYGQVPAINALIETLKTQFNRDSLSKSKKARIKDLIDVLTASIKHMDEYRAKNG